MHIASRKTLSVRMSEFYLLALKSEGMKISTWMTFNHFLVVLRDDGFYLGRQFGKVTFADGMIAIQCAKGLIQFSDSPDGAVMEAVFFEGERRQVFTLATRWPLLHELCEPVAG